MAGLIGNGEFDVNLNTWTADAPATISRDTTVFDTGSGSMLVTTSGLDQTASNDLITGLNPGAIYEVGARVRATGTGNNASMKIGWNEFDASTSYVDTEDTALSAQLDNTWLDIFQQMQLERTSEQVAVHVGCGAANANSVWVDNVFLRAGPLTPVIRSIGTVANGTGAITPGVPAGTAIGDLLIMFLETNNQAITCSGWTAVTTAQGDATDATLLTILYQIAASTTPARTTSDSGDHQIGRIMAIRGGTFDATTPFNVIAQASEATSDTSGSIPTMTTTRDQCLIIAACCTTRDLSTTTNFSGWTNASFAAAPLEEMDNCCADGAGGGFGVASGRKAVAGVVNATTVTYATASRKGLIGFAVQPPLSGTAYTESATILVDIQVTSSDVAAWVDTATVFEDIQTSAVETTDFVDASTIPFVDIVVSAAADTAQFVEQQTVGMVITPSSVEDHTTYDVATPYVLITPTSADVASFIDADTPFVDISTSSAEEHTTYDVATVPFVHVVVGTVEEHTTYEAATSFVDIQVSATEDHTTYDADTPFVDIQVATSEDHTTYDAATGTLVVTVTSADVAQFVDASTTTVFITPSATEGITHSDADNVLVDIQLSSVDTAQFVDSNSVFNDIDVSGVENAQSVDSSTPYVDIQLSSAEDHTTYDAATPYVDVQVTTVDTAQFVDSASALVDIDCSGTDLRTVTDLDSVLVDIQPSSTDTAQFVDGAIPQVFLSCTGVDVRVGDGSATVYVDIDVSGADVYTGTTAYTDTDTALVNIEAASADIAAFVDTGTVYEVMTPLTSDVSTTTESDSCYVDITCSSTDVANYVDSIETLVDIDVASSEFSGSTGTDAGTCAVVFTLTGADTAQFTDTQEVLVDITVTSTEDFTSNKTDVGTIYLDIYVITTVEVAAWLDASVVPFRMYVSAVEGVFFGTQFELVFGGTQVRWMVKFLGKRYDETLLVSRYRTTHQPQESVITA